MISCYEVLVNEFLHVFLNPKIEFKSRLRYLKTKTNSFSADKHPYNPFLNKSDDNFRFEKYFDLNDLRNFDPGLNTVGARYNPPPSGGGGGLYRVWII